MPRSKSPAQAFPPGDFIREELEARGWTQRDLAEILGRPVRTISAIVSGKRGVKPETAVALGAAFNTSPDFWLNLESAYRLAKIGPADPGIEIRARQWSKTRSAHR
jgi:HTH-type transcriptional regulator/antitoxin HigA